jgi:lipid intermediate transporter
MSMRENHPTNEMPVCVECGSPVAELYKEFSKGNIRLTKCDVCKKFADKYVEMEPMIVFLDMMLLKPKVYRHVLKNRLDRPLMKRAIWKLALTWLLLDVFLRRFRWINFFGRAYKNSLYVLVFALLSIMEFIAYSTGIYLGARLHTNSSKSLR